MILIETIAINVEVHLLCSCSIINFIALHTNFYFFISPSRKYTKSSTPLLERLSRLMLFSKHFKLKYVS